MSTSMTLFGNKPASSRALELLKGLEDNITSTIAGGEGGSRRLSIKGGRFREFIGGKEVRVSKQTSMNVVIINAAPVSRTYYAGDYVEGEAVRPTCWSADTQTPDPKVPADQRQSARCMDCPQNIKGSGKNDARACRYAQRVAVMLEGEIDKREVYQLQLPATSVFGDADGKNMPLQAYGRFLKAHDTHVMTVVTEMEFDVNAPVPKLFFRPVRPLSDDELETVIEMRDHPDTVKAITFTVSETDNVAKAAAKPQAKAEPAPAPKAEKKARAKPAPEPVQEEVEEDDEEEVVEPVKVSASRRPVAVPEDSDLDDILSQWETD